jgi:hypothetical protein
VRTVVVICDSATHIEKLKVLETDTTKLYEGEDEAMAVPNLKTVCSQLGARWKKTGADTKRLTFAKRSQTDLIEPRSYVKLLLYAFCPCGRGNWRGPSARGPKFAARARSREYLRCGIILED